MKDLVLICLIFCLFSLTKARAQDSLSIRSPEITKAPVLQEYRPLSPSKAAFYSAVLPGLGQAYNGSYWEIPIIYAGLGISIYAYVKNNEKYHSYRDAYKRRLAGYSDDQYQGQVSMDGLIEAQKQYRKNKEMAIFATVVIYALNIIWANVEAHLKQFNVSKDLSLRPNYRFDQFTGKSNYGLSLNFKF